MSNIVKTNSDEENRFKTISDFKDCLSRNGEVEFNWKGKDYSITHTIDKICIGEGLKQETEKCYDTTNSVLEYLVDGDRLRDVITQVEVLYRSF